MEIDSLHYCNDRCHFKKAKRLVVLYHGHVRLLGIQAGKDHEIV